MWNNDKKCIISNGNLITEIFGSRMNAATNQEVEEITSKTSITPKNCDALQLKNYKTIYKESEWTLYSYKSYH